MEMGLDGTHGTLCVAAVLALAPFFNSGASGVFSFLSPFAGLFPAERACQMSWKLPSGAFCLVMIRIFGSSFLAAVFFFPASRLSPKFPCTKFLRAISTTCIPNYPDKNLPTIFVYYEGQMKGQMVGPIEFRGMNLTMDEFEYLIGKTGAIKTEIKDDPKPKVKDVMMSSLRGNRDHDDLSDEGDW